MRTMNIFKVFQTLSAKKGSGKTPTGTEFGRLLDCKVTESFALVSLVYSIPKTFPRWSWGGTGQQARKRFFKKLWKIKF